MMLMSSHGASADGKLVATVIAERGSVTVSRAGGPQGQALVVGNYLDLGDTVVTGPAGQCQILFIDGSQVKLDSNSSIRVCTTAPSQRSQNLFQALIGVIWAHIRPGQVIITPAANVVVRGTEVALDISGDGATQLTVVNGDALFQNAFGQVELTDDQQSTAKPGQAPSAPIVVDVSGLISWTGEVVGLPLVFEMPSTSPGDALRRTGDAAGALTAYAAVLAADPTDANAVIGTSLTELSQGKPDSAKASLTPISTQPIAVAVSGLIDLESGNGTAARQELLNATTTDPSIYQAQSLLALSYLQDGDLGDADSAARKAVIIAPRSAEANGILSTVLFFESKNREAAAYSRLAVSIDPDSPFALLTQGRTDASAGKYEQARSEYEKALAFAPSLWLVHQELGKVYQQLDDPRKAAEEYRIALKLDPNSPDAYTGLGKALQDAGKYPAAHDAFVQAITLAPNSPSARYYYASYLVDRGDLNGAIEQIQAIVAQDPDFGLLYARLAEVYLYKQDLADAQKYALKAVKLLPNSAIAHYELGRVNYEEQHTYQAEQEFRIATVLDPRLSSARYALGLVQEKTGSGLLTSFSSIFDSAYIGSPVSTTSIYNLEAPGANNRIQAEVADPTAVRSATRSYGDTELNAIGANTHSYDASGSYLTETNSASGVAGISGETQFENGVRKNSDDTIDTANLVVGQKARDNRLGFLFLGDYQQTDQGADLAPMSETYNVDSRNHAQLSRFVAGSSMKTTGGGQLLAIVQGTDSLEGTRTSLPQTDLNYYTTHSDEDLLDGEIRWDAPPQSNNQISVGGSYGDRSLRTEEIIPSFFGAGVGDDTTWIKIKPLQAYLRDSVNEGRHWSFIGQLNYAQEYPADHNIYINPLPGFPLDNGRLGKSVILPYAIGSYSPDSTDVFRIRYRRFVAYQADFELLNPEDDFLISFDSLPTINYISGYSFAEGSGTEAEFDKTLRNGAFLSIGAFRQDLYDSDTERTYVDVVGSNDTVLLQGVQASYQAVLNRYLTYFVLGEYADAEDTSIPQRLGDIPKVSGIATLQYLTGRGIYEQAAYYYEGDTTAGQGYGTAEGAFGVLDLRAGKRFGLSSNIFVEINNVFDKHYSASDYQQPGTEVRLGTSQRF